MSKRFFVFVLLLIVALLGGLAWFQLVFLPEMIRTAIMSSPPPVVTISAEPGESSTIVSVLKQLGSYVPVSDFEQRAADISVDHPVVVSNYRAAREIAQKNDSGKATTEDLRQAMVHYRALFRELLDTADEPVLPESEKEYAR